MAGVVTTAGTVFARILMGNICDLYGPRLGAALPADIITGFLLSCSIVCQLWTTTSASSRLYLAVSCLGPCSTRYLTRLALHTY